MFFLRRLRAALVITVGWALLWSVAGVLLGLCVMRWQPATSPLPRFGASLGANLQAFALMARVGAAKGLLSGAVFAVLLAWRERRREVDTLAAPRVLVWGALSGVLWMVGLVVAALATPTPRPLGLGVAAVTLGQGALAALLAGLTLWLARRGAAPRAGPTHPGHDATRRLRSAAPQPLAPRPRTARAPAA